MRLKPYDSLSVLFHHFLHFKDDESYCRSKIFHTKKYFIIVSKTDEFANYPFNKNKSNQQMQKVFDPYKSFIRLEPFHYSQFIAINDEVFEEYISNFLN